MTGAWGGEMWAVVRREEKAALACTTRATGGRGGISKTLMRDFERWWLERRGEAEEAPYRWDGEKTWGVVEGGGGVPGKRENAGEMRSPGREKSVCAVDATHTRHGQSAVS